MDAGFHRYRRLNRFGLGGFHCASVLNRPVGHNKCARTSTLTSGADSSYEAHAYEKQDSASQ